MTEPTCPRLETKEDGSSKVMLQHTLHLPLRSLTAAPLQLAIGMQRLSSGDDPILRILYQPWCVWLLWPSGVCYVGKAAHWTVSAYYRGKLYVCLPWKWTAAGALLLQTKLVGGYSSHTQTAEPRISVGL